MNRLKTIVVGFGFMGMTHAMNILKNQNLDLVAIVDKNPDIIRKNLRDRVGNLSTGALSENDISGINLYSSLEDCIVKEKPDACVLAVHTNLHFSLTKLALEHGINVFLEKPFCLDIAEGEELINLAQNKNLLLMVGHVVRFMPPYQKLKNWIDSGEFGALKFLSMARFSGLPAWGDWKEKQSDFGSSGGALFDLLIHDIDFVQWALGIPISIESNILPGKLSRHDYLNAIWKYDSQLQVKIEGGNIFHTAYPFQAGFSAVFENASILYNSRNPENIEVANNNQIIYIQAGDAMEGYSGEMDYFADCVMSKNKPLSCMPESALESIKLGYRHI